MTSPLTRFPSASSARGRANQIGVLAFLLIANILAWAWALSAFAHQPALLGTALLAYLFGLRHAVDADHIAAIDNVVRKLMHQEQRPFSVGFYFSLGHSSVVVLAVGAIALAAAQLSKHLGSFETIGAGVSAFFLLALAAINLMILKGLWASFQRVKRGETVSAEEMDTLLSGRGLLARLFRPLFRLVTKSWHMFPIGFLFGLGFDTATEIGLLSLSASNAAHGISPWSLMVFPVLFTAGMALIDTLDSTLMVGVYGWAANNPLRKLWYNLTLTAVSALIALLIGGLGALRLLAEQLQLSGALWDAVSALNDELANFGYLMIAVFLASWALSAGIYKWKRYDVQYKAQATR
jgi:high-affinity nickel-transport protein